MKNNVMFALRAMYFAFLASIFVFVSVKMFCLGFYDRGTESVLLKTWTPVKLWADDTSTMLNGTSGGMTVNQEVFNLLSRDNPVHVRLGGQGLICVTIINGVSFTSDERIDPFILGSEPYGTVRGGDMAVMSKGKILRLDLDTLNGLEIAAISAFTACLITTGMWIALVLAKWALVTTSMRFLHDRKEKLRRASEATATV